ncbi:MAG: hypothetical protein CVT99_06685 [Bacteroidetes bacterium HGW-Bacteroidetes-16]|jgi:hypothetical protein|nr:MAG: hypothetical protein CVT99_06685 [Bacteroidetes bacterium HGW-Bacteroidetes-16]
MTILSSTRNKIILLFLISVLFYSGWKSGLERGYTKGLVATTNLVLDATKKNTYIEYEKNDNKDKQDQFRIFIEIDGCKGDFVHEPGSLAQPLGTLLSWQIFLFFVIKRKSAIQSLGLNVGIFAIVQIIFLILLTGYYSSMVHQYIFMMLSDSFNIITFILIIKDNMIYPVFRKSRVA